MDSLAAAISRIAPHITPEETISPRTLALVASESALPPETSLPRISLGGILGAEGVDPSSADLEVLSLLGEGGLGRVMLARQRSVGRDVAVKIAHDREHGSAALRSEARTMGRLEHPNVVPVHAIGRDDAGGVVLVMKRIAGVDWRSLLRDPEHAWWERLDVPASERLSFHVGVLAQVANALHFAHERGVIHRDVKPENVLIGAHGDVYLADWGVASYSGEESPHPRNSILGTPAYMAPEMVHGDPAEVGTHSDVFLLGATLHEVLVGRPRHEGRTIHAALMAAYRCEPFEYPEEVPSELAALAKAATSKDPSARPPSALAFRRALDAWRVHHGAIALTRRAQGIAAEARALFEAGDPGALTDVDRMVVEARFGFTQALREWPEYEVARSALREVLVLAVQCDVARQSVHTVRARLSEIEAPPAELVRAVEELEARHAAEQEERARLIAMERDLDLSVASSERRTLFGVLLSSGLLVSAWVFGRLALTGERPVDHIGLIGIAVAVFVPALVFAYVLRRRGAQNAAGASVVRAILMGIGTILVNRVIGAVAGTPFHALLATDCLIYAAVLATQSAAPRLAWLAPGLVVGALGCMLVPRFPGVPFGLVVLPTLAVAIGRWSWFMRRGARTATENGAAHVEQAKPERGA